MNVKSRLPILKNSTLHKKNPLSTFIDFLDFSTLHPSFIRVMYVQCNPDLVTSYLVTNLDLVTILQKTIFLVHKNISFSDNLVFSTPSI